jgi:uncharacterized membrane protein
MLALAAAVAMWASVQVALSAPALRLKLKSALGRLFIPLVGLVSLLLVGALILAWREAHLKPLYAPPSWGRSATFAALAIASLLLGVSAFRGSLRRYVRFPLPLALAFWAMGHLFVRGDLASIILFGGALAIAGAQIALAVAGSAALPDTRPGHDLLSILGGIALFAAMAQLHPLITGLSILSLTG